jgi:hypothetical protein
MKFLDVPQSGSIGGVTSGRNRFGQYKRTRATPVNVNSGFQGVVRARLAANSAAWRALTDAQRAGWRDLAIGKTRTDFLGQVYTMQGNQMYASVNNNRVATGLTPVADAPAIATPVALLTVTLTLTAAAFSIAYTATPLGAATYLQVFASPQRSAGRNFEGDYRLIKTSAAAQASPFVILTEYTARFGVPILGSRIFLALVTTTAGFQSGPFNLNQVVA